MRALQEGHLIDDYTLSRNMARFGLKMQTVISMRKDGLEPVRIISSATGRSGGQSLAT